MDKKEILTLEDALEWADKNCSDEACSRLRSRAVAKILAESIRKLQSYASVQRYLNNERY